MKLAKIKQKILDLPKTSGVYLFKDKAGEVIYIGKAKNLRRRVASYVAERVTLWTVQMLQSEAVDLEFFVTKSEHSALILEAELVKKYRPKFNTLLKDGQPALYLAFVTSKKMPEFKVVRVRKEAGDYIGPFLNAKHVRSIYNLIKKKFRLTLCKTKIKTGCLDYHMGLCAGNCKDDFEPSAYQFRFELAFKTVKGDLKNIHTQIDQQIAQAIAKMAYEEARELTEYKQSIEIIKQIVAEKFKTNEVLSDLTYKASGMAAQSGSSEAAATDIQQILSLKDKPRVIDCFDISHFQSREIVGSCIRFVNCIPEKKSFRRFKIKSLIEQNDYAALAEIVQRRYKNGDFPDLIIIDGGIGQLNAVLYLVGDTPIASLAKREELLFLPHAAAGIAITAKTPGGKTILALRDYAHHFAITYHRSRRDRLA